MTRYKVASRVSPRMQPGVDRSRLSDALALANQFGLNAFTLGEIVETWECYSDTYAAGWLTPDRESIESAFGVILEEINDNPDPDYPEAA